MCKYPIIDNQNDLTLQEEIDSLNKDLKYYKQERLDSTNSINMLIDQMLFATKWETNETKLKELIEEKKEAIKVSLTNIVQNMIMCGEDKVKIRNLEKQQSKSFLIK